MDLLPGYVLVHHDSAWWDKLMEFGESKADGDVQKADPRATHIDLVSQAPGTLGKMNPPSSCLYPASTLDFSTITLLRFKPIADVAGVLVDVHQDAEFAALLLQEIDLHLQEPYDWSQILRFVGIGLEGVVDSAGAKAALKQADPDAVRRGHFGVCSVWTEARLEAALAKRFGRQFDLTAGSVAGKDDAEPSDWTTFPMLERG